LIGLDRKQVAYKLVEGKTLPCMWRRKQADILMDVGDDEPAHLYMCDDFVNKNDKISYWV